MKKSKIIVRVMFLIAFLISLAGYLVLQDVQFFVTLLLMIPIPFLQNMAFTWVSRSRQGGDPEYHRYAAWASNGVWLLTQSFIAANVYSPISKMVDNGVDANSVWKIVFTFLIYAIMTAEGSVFMMKINLGKVKVWRIFGFLVESGKRKVGER